MTLSNKQQHHLSSDLTCDPSLMSSLSRQKQLGILSLKKLFQSNLGATIVWPEALQDCGDGLEKWEKEKEEEEEEDDYY
ncbi:hypothetical protein ACLKA6_016785 [Drosophila palustris]